MSTPTPSGGARPRVRGTGASTTGAVAPTTASSSGPVPTQATESSVPPSDTLVTDDHPLMRGFRELASGMQGLIGRQDKISGGLDDLKAHVDGRFDALESLLRQIHDTLTAGVSAATTVLPTVAPRIRQVALLLATGDSMTKLGIFPRRQALIEALRNSFQDVSDQEIEQQADSVFAINRDGTPNLDQVRRNIADLCVARLSEIKAEGKTAVDVEDELSARIDSLNFAENVKAEHDQIYIDAKNAVFGEVRHAAH